jgi:tetratricopeptide (TPR) repeat protein
LYHLGFIRVATGRCEEAIQYLREGRKLEPTNPRFFLEEAQANVQMGDFWAAMALLNEVGQVGPHTGAQEIGLTLRAKGFILIEMDELDLAEEVYAQSLECDPENELALNQLRYIDHLRRGGRRAPTRLLERKPTAGLVCHRCGAAVREGSVTSINGRIVCECRGCGPDNSRMGTG